MARRAARQSRPSLPPTPSQRLRRRLRGAAMADVEDGEETCALASHSGSSGSKSGGDKMFSLKKWNAVAMWSWDVECDTCAICRVQVMGKRCHARPGPRCGLREPTSGLGRDGRPPEALESPLPWGVGGGRPARAPEERGATILLRLLRAEGLCNRRPAPGGWCSRERNGQ